MRIPPLPASVTHPEDSTGVHPITGVGAPGPVEARRDNRQPSPPPPEPQTMRYEQVEDRREFARRGDERRKRQIRIMLDTRVSPRRTDKRREDDVPGSVDLEV